ncbi:MAG: hypothetical protein Q9227_008356 [Pyrenula ochraceoflavens]
MTVLFHIEGNTAVKNESLMMYIGVFAYGESRFDLTFNPCNANIYSLCPMNSSVPIQASGIIPVNQNDVANIPPMALQIPDFEGQAILRIFANSTESQIGCYSAVVTNGASFSHPSAVGSVLGVFAAVALISSIATSIYGESLPETRKHYAHSVSVWVVFAVYHHIFFTGTLSMNWPSVLPAFWSNYAWSTGMIYSQKMQNSINQFIGSNRGNISMVGAAPSGVDAENLGGGYSISQIYKRAVDIPFRPFDGFGSTLRSREIEHALARRDSPSNGTSHWYGSPVQPGLPLPGNFSGFAGTLSQEGIPLSNAFMTGLLWFLAFLACLILAVVLLKVSVEFFVKRTNRFNFFRDNWLKFLQAIVGRAFFVGFFMFMVLTMFQFTLSASVGVTVLAAIVFFIFYMGMMATAAYAMFYRLRGGRYAVEMDRLNVEKKKILGVVPWWSVTRDSKVGESQGSKPVSNSLPWRRVHFLDNNPERAQVHEDHDYIIRFGWLAARFRRTKWWAFSLWLVYEFVRACFYGGAAGHPLTQVFGLLVVECIAFLAIIWLRPFESTRLNLIMIYCLGFSKVTTVALSAAFDIQFNLGRILTTVLGVVIIVIQGILTIFLLIAITLGAVSSYMSITRYREDFHPKSWAENRGRYFKHIDRKATDLPPPPPSPPPPEPEKPKEPYFSVTNVTRQLKIEDEDEDAASDLGRNESRSSLPHLAGGELGRAPSLYSQSMSNLPYGARRHRASWSTRDFEQMQSPEQQQAPAAPWTMHPRMSDIDLHETARRHRASSIKSSGSPVAADAPPLPALPHRFVPEVRSRASTMKARSSPRMDSSLQTVDPNNGRQRSMSLKHPRKVSEESESSDHRKRSSSLKGQHPGTFDGPMPPLPARVGTPPTRGHRSKMSSSSNRLSQHINEEPDAIREVPSQNQ